MKTIENLKQSGFYKESHLDEIKTPLFYVQETIGGWRQNAIFSGTLEECEEYMKDCYGNFSIVHEDDYEVDYL